MNHNEEKIIGVLGSSFFFQETGPQMKMKTKITDSKDYFPITAAEIQYNTDEAILIKKSAEMIANDIIKITDKKPALITNNAMASNMIIIGTPGKNHLIDQLVAEKKIHIEEIQNKWEQFCIQTVDKPFDGVDSALIIAGSDRRGTAYGVFTLSEAMGISPWHWWADIPVTKHEDLYITKGRYTSKPPSVKYRGIFINDEDWGFRLWSGKTFDPELGDIGPKTYEKVYQLLLRLKGNIFAPAMHDCTRAFYTVPGNSEMADDYGIIITTSHCEPLLYNNASEWDKEKQGSWNYLTNKEEINRVLRKRVKEAAGNENIYTIALRGIHDEGIQGVEEDQMKEVLEQAIRDQRAILSEYIDKPIEEIPQIFVPYKEVLKIYEQGMDLPEDIIIIWPDDNYGYMKRLSSPEEQKRKGRSGVYYHISYLGWPNDYLWLNTTPPALMYSELEKAYNQGADAYWVLNVGDIKPGETGIQLFMDMAWNLDQFNYNNIHHYQAKFLASLFGESLEKELNSILERYYFHAFTRKPEYMTWNFQWNSHFLPNKIKDTDYSFINYREAEKRLEDYENITQKAEAILEKLPLNKKPAFFQMLYYPVKAASLYNHEILISQKNRWYAVQKRSMTNELAERACRYHDELDELTYSYNTMLNGKWKHMMPAQGFIPEKQYPPTEKIEIPKEAKMGLLAEGLEYTESHEQRLPPFSRYFKQSYYFEIFNQGSEVIKWQAKPNAKWILLKKPGGEIKTQERIPVSIDWEKLPAGESVQGEIEVSDSKNNWLLKIEVFNPQSPSPSEMKGRYVEHRGVVCISPAEYMKKTEQGGILFQPIRQLGYCQKALQLGHGSLDSGQNSFVEFDFYTFGAGKGTVYIYALPLFAKVKNLSTSYSIQIDDQKPIAFHNDVEEYSMDWAKNVIRNSAINKSEIFIKNPGKHSIKLFAGDPGMIIQKIIIDLGGLKKSYIGPEPTLLNN